MSLAEILRLTGLPPKIATMIRAKAEWKLQHRIARIAAKQIDPH